MVQLEAFSFFPKRNQSGLDVHSSVTALEGVGRGGAEGALTPPTLEFGGSQKRTERKIDNLLLFPLRNKNPNAVIYIAVIPEIS